MLLVVALIHMLLHIMGIQINEILALVPHDVQSLRRDSPNDT